MQKPNLSFASEIWEENGRQKEGKQHKKKKKKYFFTYFLPPGWSPREKTLLDKMKGMLRERGFFALWDSRAKLLTEATLANTVRSQQSKQAGENSQTERRPNYHSLSLTWWSKTKDFCIPLRKECEGSRTAVLSGPSALRVDKPHPSS